MPVWHLTYSSDERFPLFPGEARRRRALRRLARMNLDLALFCMVENHSHVVNLAEAVRAGRKAQAIWSAWRRIAESQLDPAFMRRVRDRSHLQWLVRYVLTQPIKHKIRVHPALWSGSCFQDYVGARFVPGLSLRISEVLPELEEKTVLGYVGLTPAAIRPLGDADVRAVGARRIVEAAASAVAADPDLHGWDPACVAARRVSIQLGRQVGLSDREVQWALDVSRRTLLRAKPRVNDDRRVSAVRVRLALERALGPVDPRTGLEVVVRR